MDGRIGTNGFDASGGSRSMTARTSQINGLSGSGVKSTPRPRRAWVARSSRRNTKLVGLFVVFAAAILIASAVALLPSGKEKASAPEKILSRPPDFPFLVFGYVFDTDGTTPLVGANVTITNLNSLEVNWTETDGTGFYSENVNEILVYPTQYNVGDVINVTIRDVSGLKMGWAEGSTSDPDAVFLWLDITVVDVAIPEFSTLILPVMGLAALVIVVQLNRRRNAK